MSDRNVVLYFSWSRPGETGAPLGVLENRFPALFESRRMRYPKLQELADAGRFDQGIAGFLDHLQKPNFAAFAEQAAHQTGRPVVTVERIADDGSWIKLDESLLGGADTLVIISFDSLRTEQKPTPEEIETVRRFLDDPDHLLFVCPHHDIGFVPDQPAEAGREQQLAEFLHHGDRSIPSQQGFGGFARSLLSELGIPVENRYGLRPLVESDGSPAPIEVEVELDTLQLLSGVPTLNLHAHLPHFERLGDAVNKVDVLARQKIDLTAPPHPFTRDGRKTFDALLQSRPEVFPGRVLMGDSTLFSSTAGGVESLRKFWANIVRRPPHAH